VEVTLPEPDDTDWMSQAVAIARANGARPFGAVIVDTAGKVVGRGTDQSNRDPTRHDVMEAIRAAVTAAGHAGLIDATVYATAEPCPMCASAIVWSGIRRVVFGASAAVLKSVGLRGIDIGVREIVDRSERAAAVEVTAGVLEDMCVGLYRNDRRDA
jgi:tRNA(Arg) A34 adenosine deaminase TadA